MHTSGRAGSGSGGARGGLSPSRPRALRAAMQSAIAVGFACAVVLLAGSGTALAEEKSMQRTITVSGVGTVYADPDIARLTSGLVTEGATAQAALAANTEAMRKVIAEVKAQGIEGKDVQTTSFHVEPVMVHPKDGPPRISGYRVSNGVSVTVRNIDKVGEVLDRLVSAGANQISGLAFEVSKADILKDDARKLAVENALRRARLLAAAAGAEVGHVLQISEDGEGGPPQPMFRAAKAMSAGAVPVERGTQALEARVTATWELK